MALPEASISPCTPSTSMNAAPPRVPRAAPPDVRHRLESSHRDRPPVHREGGFATIRLRSISLGLRLEWLNSRAPGPPGRAGLAMGTKARGRMRSCAPARDFAAAGRPCPRPAPPPRPPNPARWLHFPRKPERAGTLRAHAEPASSTRAGPSRITGEQHEKPQDRHDHRQRLRRAGRMRRDRRHPRPPGHRHPLPAGDAGLFHLRPRLRLDGELFEHHHLHRRAGGGVALSRLSDRAARRAQQLPGDLPPPAVRRTADQNANGMRSTRRSGVTPWSTRGSGASSPATSTTPTRWGCWSASWARSRPSTTTPSTSVTRNIASWPRSA